MTRVISTPAGCWSSFWTDCLTQSKRQGYSMTNKKKYLVVWPGLPRSGTTYTFHSISQTANRDFFNIPYKKELNFFSRDRTAEEFIDQYDSDNDNKYYIDYSPSYLVGAPNSIERIQRYSGIFNFKFILHLRHPVDQMYAHYLHD